MRSILVIALSVFLMSCSSVNKEFFSINEGESKESVLNRMGPPDDRQFEGENEVFQYCTTGTSFGKSTFNVVWLFSGEVTGANSYTVSHAGSCMGYFRQINWEDAPDVSVEIRLR